MAGAFDLTNISDTQSASFGSEGIKFLKASTFTCVFVTEYVHIIEGYDYVLNQPKYNL